MKLLSRKINMIERHWGEGEREGGQERVGGRGLIQNHLKDES